MAIISTYAEELQEAVYELVLPHALVADEEQVMPERPVAQHLAEDVHLATLGIQHEWRGPEGKPQDGKPCARMHVHTGAHARGEARSGR